MIHIGIDHHKKYSHVVALSDDGKVHFDGRLSSTPEAFARLKADLPSEEPVQSVLEAGRSWGLLYDALEELGLNPKLANPAKTRMIADSYVKTDRLDATAHALLLKAGMSALVHVPPRETRDKKNIVRERFWLVRIRTGLKNRIHNILDRNHVSPPECTDIFGSRGRAWMSAARLPEIDDRLLRADLALLETIERQIKETEKWTEEALADNALMPVLQSFPGIGKTLAALIALEVDVIERFPTAGKFCAYSGVVNSTYSSGGKTRHGGLIPACNRHLRYAFIEAAWTTARVSPYFGAYYKRLRARVGAQDAIGAVARKLCEIAYTCMRNKRAYEERPYQYRPAALRNS